MTELQLDLRDGEFIFVFQKLVSLAVAVIDEPNHTDFHEMRAIRVAILSLVTQRIINIEKNAG